MTANEKACVVAIEVDGRQKYLLETDKLREMLGASRIIAQTVAQAEQFFLREADSLHLFSPVSGEIRAWALMNQRDPLLSAAWKLRCWLNERGVEHTAAYFETRAWHFLEESRSPTKGAREPIPEEEPDGPDLAWVHKSIQARIRRRKDAKSGEDARPSCSLFVPCRIHGLDPANVWKPGTDSNRETRREQVGFRAAWKFSTWRSDKEELYDEYLRDPIWDRIPPDLLREIPVDRSRPISSNFLDLADKDDDAPVEDQYIAFLCADGDDMGRLLSQLDWNSPAWVSDGKKPWERNAAFSRELDRCTRTAFAEAVAQIVIPDEADKAKVNQAIAREFLEHAAKGYKLDLPMLPQLLGGDDLWTVASREVALDLCCSFAKKFKELAANAEKNPTLNQAIVVARRQKPERGQPVLESQTDDIRLTMSLGVAFAKAGYPAYAMAEAAESLLKSAKALRKGKAWGRIGEGVNYGCVDWHWIESSLSEPVEEARKKGWSYQNGNEVMLLTSRPWSVPQCQKFLEAAHELTRVPRRKRQQLESILRLGHTLSLLAWESWWKGLKKEEKEAVEEANRALPDEWKLPSATNTKEAKNIDQCQPGDETTYYATPLLDLLALHDVLGIPEGTPADEENETEADKAAVPGKLGLLPWKVLGQQRHKTFPEPTEEQSTETGREGNPCQR